MTTVSIQRLSVEVEGDGDAVVMVHGLGGTSNTFQPQMEALRDYRVIRVDLPGAGRSPAGYDAPSMQGFADAMMGLASALGVRRAHWVGHSMGTIVCQQVAADRPDLVASLTLFGPLAEPSDAMRTALATRAKLARHEGMAQIADSIVGTALSSDTRTHRPAAVAFVRESIMRQDPHGYAGHCEALAGARAADHRLIDVPTLLVAGEADPTAPPSGAQGLAARLKGASVAVIERSGHWLTIEKPQDCNRALRDFLSRVLTEEPR